MLMSNNKHDNVLTIQNNDDDTQLADLTSESSLQMSPYINRS